MANTNLSSPTQNEIEALKKFAETAPLQPVEPHKEVSGDQADKEALQQYAKEHVAEAAKPSVLTPVETAQVPSPMPTTAEVQALEKDQVMVEVEKLLEKDLGKVFASLPEQIKPFFKTHGEKVASTVANMVKSKTFDGGIVLDMVEDWLKLIPKNNSAYLEQMAKLKTDALVKYAEAATKE